MSTIEEYRITMTEQNQKVFDKNKNRPRGPGTPPPTTGGTPSGGGTGGGTTGGSTGRKEIYPEIPPKPSIESINWVESIRKINNLDPSQDRATIETIIRNSGQLSDTTTRYINPIIKLQYIDKDKFDITDEEEFQQRLNEEIERRSPKELEISLDIKMLRDERVQKAILSKATLDDFYALIGDQRKAGALKDILKDYNTFSKTKIVDWIQRELNLPNDVEAILRIQSDPHLHADALAEAFEEKFGNEELGRQLADLRLKQKSELTFPQLMLKEQLGLE